jgi:hypothetical protein
MKKPKYPLKAWGDPAWRRKLSTVIVSRVDEDIPTEKQKPIRKPWFVALTQKPDLLTKVGGIVGLPAGNTVLLSERDVLALVQYLFEPQTVVWADKLSHTKPGKFGAVLFSQPGMLAISADGHVWNGEAPWTPSYFERQDPINPKNPNARRTRKIHTLPWQLELGKRGKR